MINILEWVADKADKYKELIKVGASASKAYLDYQDAKRKGELQEAAYEDYMREAEAAGQEAQAAIDIGLTPMPVTNVPTTKADVTDFTAVAAKGGLMSIPNKQRKRYAYGPNPDDFQTEFEMNPPFDPREEGISIGEQVFYNTGRGDRANAKMIWDQMGNDDKSIFDFNFEIFFNNGGWRDMIKGSLDVEQSTQTASHEVNDRILESLYEEHYDRLHGLGHSDDAIHKIIMQMFDDMSGAAPKQEEGIMQAAKGGRIGYRRGRVVHPGGYSGVDWGDDGREDLARKLFGKALKDLLPEELRDLENEVERLRNKFMATGGITKLKKGGRVKYAYGSQGIMDLGGLEKDYRTTGGFVPIGAYEKKDDVPARLSKNEFVFTADAVRAAGGGSINKGAQRMYNTMKHLETQPTAKRITA
tara:strand:- start:316 stop:1560 length:1245 start_codon:yes stop_codon:yes gene_type:complete